MSSTTKEITITKDELSDFKTMIAGISHTCAGTYAALLLIAEIERLTKIAEPFCSEPECHLRTEHEDH